MRKIELLTEKQVRNAKPDKGKFVKRLLDGAGLYLQATAGKDGVNRNWILRYELDGARHDMGIGPLHTVGLAEARRRARDLRLQILDGVDPLEAREEERAERRAKAQAARAEMAKVTTFRQCVDLYLKKHGAKWQNAKHAAQWRSTLKTYAYDVLGDLNVADIDQGHLVKVLEPIWRTKAETARRVRGRIEAILTFATAYKFRTGDNPARRDLINTLLGGTQKVVEHHAALPFDECPAFMVELRGRKSTSAAALEFAILTAGRTGEVIGARWDEIDLKHKTWIIPKERMKAKREHRVALCDRAVQILKGIDRRGDMVFGSAVTGRPLSNMALLELLRGMRPGAGLTVHGFRSSFRDWASERTNFAREVVEMALAHAVGDKVEAAYRRGDLFEKRRKLMEAWAGFLARPVAAEADNVLSIKRA
jgi:integrase